VKAEGFRTDLTDYFEMFRLGTRQGKLRNVSSTPFMVIEPDSDTVKAVRCAWDVMNLPPDTLVMQAWPGQYSTDVFAYSVKEMNQRLTAMIVDDKMVV